MSYREGNMIEFIKELSNSDSEFLSIMLLFDKWVVGNRHRVIYIPEYMLMSKISRKNKGIYSKTIFDDTLLLATIVKFTPYTALNKTRSILSNFGGTIVYIPRLESVCRSIRNDNIKTCFQLGFSYNDLKKCFNMSYSGIRKIITLKKTQDSAI